MVFSIANSLVFTTERGSWMQGAAAFADQFLELRQTVSSQGHQASEVHESARKLMRVLLSFPLLGRPASSKQPFLASIHCYWAKFLFNAAPQLLATLVPHAVAMQREVGVLFTFIGPAPRSLYATIKASQKCKRQHMKCLGDLREVRNGMEATTVGCRHSLYNLQTLQEMAICHFATTWLQDGIGFCHQAVAAQHLQLGGGVDPPLQASLQRLNWPGLHQGGAWCFCVLPFLQLLLLCWPLSLLGFCQDLGSAMVSKSVLLFFENVFHASRTRERNLGEKPRAPSFEVKWEVWKPQLWLECGDCLILGSDFQASGSVGECFVRGNGCIYHNWLGEQPCPCAPGKGGARPRSSRQMPDPTSDTEEDLCGSQDTDTAGEEPEVIYEEEMMEEGPSEKIQRLDADWLPLSSQPVPKRKAKSRGLIDFTKEIYSVDAGRLTGEAKAQVLNLAVRLRVQPCHYDLWLFYSFFLLACALPTAARHVSSLKFNLLAQSSNALCLEVAMPKTSKTST